jgi:outer membrane protein assembly factor BamE
MIRAASLPASLPFVLRFAAPAALLALAACKSVEVPKLPGVTPYRMVIQQGNFISQEMVEQLKPGMTKEQVRFVLGTPLVADIFHADRWDYVYYRELPNGKKEQRNLVVMFEGSKLTRVVGDLMPPEGAKPQASGFVPLIKPEPEKPAAAKEPAKPAAEGQAAAKPAPAPAKAAESWDPPKQNWGTAGDAPAEKPQAVVEKKEEQEPAKPAEEAKEEKGFFGRMWDKVRK